jgi:hypothetical protein
LQSGADPVLLDGVGTLALMAHSDQERYIVELSGVDSIEQQIVREVTGWPGVTTATHRFGGIELRVGHRELGHLHGSRVADLPFPVRVREELVATGKAEPHHVLPQSGWVSYYIRDRSDIANVVALFRLNYDRPWAAPQSS